MLATLIWTNGVRPDAMSQMPSRSMPRFFSRCHFIDRPLYQSALGTRGRARVLPLLGTSIGFDHSLPEASFQFFNGCPVRKFRVPCESSVHLVKGLDDELRDVASQIHRNAGFLAKPQVAYQPPRFQAGQVARQSLVVRWEGFKSDNDGKNNAVHPPLEKRQQLIFVFEVERFESLLPLFTPSDRLPDLAHRLTLTPLRMNRRRLAG